MTNECLLHRIQYVYKMTNETHRELDSTDYSMCPWQSVKQPPLTICSTLSWLMQCVGFCHFRLPSPFTHKSTHGYGLRNGSTFLIKIAGSSDRQWKGEFCWSIRREVVEGSSIPLAHQQFQWSWTTGPTGTQTQSPEYSYDDGHDDFCLLASSSYIKMRD